MGSAYIEHDRTCVIHAARTPEGAQRIIDRVVGAKALTTVTPDNRPDRYTTALVFFPGQSSYTLHDTTADGRLNQCLLTVVIDEISFDATAFLDLTAGEQASLLRMMTDGERLRLAVDVATYFRSIHYSCEPYEVLNGFTALMSLREGIAGRGADSAHCTTTPNNLQMEVGQ